MDLDWCIEEDLINTKSFNDTSIINLSVEIDKSNNSKSTDNLNTTNYDLKIENCFFQNTDVSNPKDLLNTLNYLSLVSYHLKTLMRNKSIKNNETKEITENDFYEIIHYLDWIKNATNNIKKHFICNYKKDNNIDPNNFKLFKTSSYKFCNFKDSCSTHKIKGKICEKNHFVFDMIINDIDTLIYSLNILNFNNLYSVLSNKYVLFSYDHSNNSYLFDNVFDNNFTKINDNQFYIEKKDVFKSFDVISFVLNRMYEESNSFLNFNLKSNLIVI
jgi:hypothetical protein